MALFTVLLAIATSKVDLAEGSPGAGQLKVDLLDSTGAVVATQSVDDAAAPSISFNGVAAGTYTATATLSGLDGMQIGSVATSDAIVVGAVVPPPVLTANAPSAITATVLAE